MKRGAKNLWGYKEESEQEIKFGIASQYLRRKSEGRAGDKFRGKREKEDRHREREIPIPAHAENNAGDSAIQNGENTAISEEGIVSG